MIHRSLFFRRARKRAFGSRGTSFSVERVGFHRHPFDDLYHYLLVSSWRKLLLVFMVVFLAVNLLFAGAYLLVEGSIQGARGESMVDAFFFSVQTISTVGYGGMSPDGFYANIVSTMEAFIGLVGFALLAGLIFAKFSRPTARVMFSRVAVMGQWEGAPALLVRMANSRNNQVVDARVSLHLLMDTPQTGGGTMRKFIDLALVRARTPIFALTWTAVHLVDETSPLWGLKPEDLKRLNVQLFAIIIGTDESYMQEIHARRVYGPDELAWNARFADVLTRAQEGHLRLDYSHFHEVMPLEESIREMALEGP